jgi:hypothetical protein
MDSDDSDARVVGANAVGIRHPLALLTLRDAFGWVSRDIARAPNSAALWMPESAAYVGIMTLLAAPLGLLIGTRDMRYFSRWLHSRRLVPPTASRPFVG